MSDKFRYFPLILMLIAVFFILNPFAYSEIRPGDDIEFYIGNWHISGTITDIDIHITLDGTLEVEDLGLLSLSGLKISAMDYMNNGEIIITDHGTVSLENAVFGGLNISSISGHIDTGHLYGSAVLNTNHGVLDLAFDVLPGGSFVFMIMSKELQFGQLTLTGFMGSISEQGISGQAYLNINGFSALMDIFYGDNSNFYASMEHGSLSMGSLSLTDMNLLIDSSGNVQGGCNAYLPAFGGSIETNIYFSNDLFVFAFSLPVIDINGIHYRNLSGIISPSEVVLNGELYIAQTGTTYGFTGLSMDMHGNILESPLIYIQNLIIGDIAISGQMKIIQSGFLLITAQISFLDTVLTVTNVRFSQNFEFEYADNITLENLNAGGLVISGNASLTMNPFTVMIEGNIIHQDWNLSVSSMHLDRDGNIISLGSAHGQFNIDGINIACGVEFENQNILQYSLIINLPSISIDGWSLNTAVLRISSEGYSIVSAQMVYMEAVFSVSNISFDTQWNLVSMDNISVDNVILGQLIFSGNAFLQSEPRAFVFSGSIGNPPDCYVTIESLQLSDTGVIINMGTISTGAVLGDFEFYGTFEFEGNSIADFILVLSAEELILGDIRLLNFSGSISSAGFSGSGHLAFNGTDYLVLNISVSDEGVFTGGIMDGSLTMGAVVLSSISIILDKGGIVSASASGNIPFLYDSQLLFGFEASSTGYLMLTASAGMINTGYFIINSVSLTVDNYFINISGQAEFTGMGGATAYIENLVYSLDGEFISAGSFGIENLLINGFYVSGQAQLNQQGIIISAGAINLNNTGFSITNLGISWSGEVLGMDSFAVSNLGIGDFSFSGSAVLVNYPESLMLSGSIGLGSIGYISVSSLCMDGDWNIISVQQASASISIQSVAITGEAVLFKDMIYISGSALLPFLNGPVAFMADIIKAEDGTGLFDSGYQIIAGGVSIPEFQAGGYSILNSSLYFDSDGIEGEGGLVLPQTASVSVAFKFGWDGTFYHAFLAATGMNIPLGTSGLFLQGAGGGLYHYYEPEEWVVELYGMLGDATQTLQGDVLLSVSNLGIVSGIGCLYLRGIPMGMSSFEFNNPGQVFTCQAWLGEDPNQGLDIYFASLRGAVGFQKNWGYHFTRGYGYISINIYFLPVLSGKVFLSDNGGYPASCFLPGDGLSAGVQVGFWNWKRVYGARVLWDPWSLDAFECSEFPDYSTNY